MMALVTRLSPSLARLAGFSLTGFWSGRSCEGGCEEFCELRFTISCSFSTVSLSCLISAAITVTHTRTLGGVCCQSSGEMPLLGGEIRSPLMGRYSTALRPPLATPLNTYDLLIVQPDTLIRWHRDLFKIVWRRQSKAKPKSQPVTLLVTTIRLIGQLATETGCGAQNVSEANC